MRVGDSPFRTLVFFTEGGSGPTLYYRVAVIQ